MSKRNLFNGFGYAGQHGQAAELLNLIWENQQQIMADITLIKEHLELEEESQE